VVAVRWDLACTHLVSCGKNSSVTRQNLPLQRHQLVETDTDRPGNGSAHSPHTGHVAQRQISAYLRDRNSSAVRFVVEKQAKSRDCTAHTTEVIQFRPNTRGDGYTASPSTWNKRWRRSEVVAVRWDLACTHLVSCWKNSSPTKTYRCRGTNSPKQMQTASGMVPLAAHTLDMKRSGKYRRT
jgi:hypothetical protein